VSGITISAIKADICGCVGHFAVHQDLIAEARRGRVKDAVIQGPADRRQRGTTGRRADARALGADRGTGPDRRVAVSGMSVGVGDRSVSQRVRERARSRRPRRAAIVPVVLVMPGYERFVSGLSRKSFTRAAVRRFPNGELFTVVPQCVERRRCVVVGSISPPAGNIERLTLVAHTLRRSGAARVTVLLPYLAYARQDRAARSESLGLRWAGELLRATGVDEVLCVDVHSKQAADVLGLTLTSLSPAELLAGALPPPWRSEVTFVAPDEGAVDRCSAVARAAGVDRPVV